MNRKSDVIKVNVSIAICLTVVFWFGLAISAIETDHRVSCYFDQSSGQMNPFGGRAFITVIETGGDTIFTFEQFPSPVISKNEPGRTTTIENTRTLVFYDTDVETARALVRMNLEYYYSLIGYEDVTGYSSYDEAMTCKQN